MLLVDTVEDPVVGIEAVDTAFEKAGCERMEATPSDTISKA